MIKSLFSRSGNADFSKETDKRRPAIIPHHYDFDEEKITKYLKSSEDEVLIKSALENNDFLSSLLLEGKRLQKVVDAMHPEDVAANQIIIKEGDVGSHLYVSVKGVYQITQKGEVVNSFSDVRVFGELALLYNSRRLATIKARTAGKVWMLDRIVFKHIMVRSDIEEHKETVDFLQTVPKLNSIDKSILEQVADLLKTEFFVTGTRIVKEGGKGEKFYVIRAGSVTVSKQNTGDIDKLDKTHFFGELALLKENTRQATITADAPGTECLTLTRQEFIDYFGDIPDFFSINYQTVPYKPMKEVLEHTDLKLNDFNILATLGLGGFGRVEFVQHGTKKDLVFALKYLKKYVIALEKQQEHVYNEKNVQLACDNPFIVRLYRTFKDNKYLYLLLEVCLGGDLWNLLHRQKSRRLDEDHAKFYVACVVEALTYLHERGIIYRDLKPENLLLDSKGYIKLTDFGFAKKLEHNKKTYTFAGTPEYVPPETILNRGHDRGVDCWALGIFIFELLTGSTPFRTNDPSFMKTYKMILKGIENAAFPSYMSSRAKHIIRKLCKSIPAERLGSQRGGIRNVKSHVWFMGFNWDTLGKGEMLPPYKPNLKNNLDTHYFDKFPKDMDIPLDDVSGWDEDF